MVDRVKLHAMVVKHVHGKLVQSVVLKHAVVIILVQVVDAVDTHVDLNGLDGVPIVQDVDQHIDGYINNKEKQVSVSFCLWYNFVR